jgi:hypothetical protein
VPPPFSLSYPTTIPGSEHPPARACIYVSQRGTILLFAGMAPHLTGGKHNIIRGMIHDGKRTPEIVKAVYCGKRSIMNIQSNVRCYGTTRTLGDYAKRSPSVTTANLELPRQSSSESIFRCQYFLRTLSTQSARMNSLPNFSLQMPGFNFPLNLPSDVSMGCFPFIDTAN